MVCAVDGEAAMAMDDGWMMMCYDVSSEVVRLSTFPAMRSF